MKKVLNILGIIMAWLLSVVLVVMLIVTPLTFSALSLLNGDTVAKVVIDTLTSVIDNADSQPSAENGGIMSLSDTTQPADTEKVGKDILEDMLGDKISQEQMGAILSSKAAKELIQAYTGDLTNAIIGGSQETSFTADNIKRIVNDNIDEIVEVLQTAAPELADADAAELKSSIQKAVDEGAEEIVNALPKPEEIKEELLESVPALESVIEILAMKDTIKLTVIGAIVLLSGLIFLCRIPGLRGFRWLGVNLFIGAGMNAFISSGLLASKTAVAEIAEQAGVQAAGMIGSLLSAFTTGMVVRTFVMLAAGGALLAAYILLKNLREKNLAEAGQVQA